MNHFKDMVVFIACIMPNMHINRDLIYIMTGNARWRTRRPCYKAVVNIADFEALVPASATEDAVVRRARCRQIYKGINF